MQAGITYCSNVTLSYEDVWDGNVINQCFFFSWTAEHEIPEDWPSQLWWSNHIFDQLPWRFIAQWLEHRTSITKVMGSIPFEARIFFRLRWWLLSFASQLRWSFFQQNLTNIQQRVNCRLDVIVELSVEISIQKSKWEPNQFSYPTIPPYQRDFTNNALLPSIR